MNIFDGDIIGAPNIFTGSEIGSPNIFTGDLITIYPPPDIPDPLFGRLTAEFGSLEPVFGED